MSKGNNPDCVGNLNDKKATATTTKTEAKEIVATSANNMSGETITPHDNDILMGRGGKNNQWVGNEQLRVMAREQSENYRLSSKKGKSYISRELVRKVRQLDPPGRFLKKNNTSGEWEDVGDQIAREKASQVLRDAVSVVLTSRNDASEEELSHEMEQKMENEHRRSSSAPPVMGSKRRREQPPTADWNEYHGNTQAQTPTPTLTPVTSNPQAVMPSYSPSDHEHYAQVTPSTQSQAKRRRYHSSQRQHWEESRIPSHPYQHSPYRRHHQHHYSHPLPPQHPGHPQYHHPHYTRSMSYSDGYRPPQHHATTASPPRYYSSHQSRREPPPRRSNLMGDVQQGFDEFDLFNGELLRDPSEEEENSVSTS